MFFLQLLSFLLLLSFGESKLPAGQPKYLFAGAILAVETDISFNSSHIKRDENQGSISVTAYDGLGCSSGNQIGSSYTNPVITGPGCQCFSNYDILLTTPKTLRLITSCCTRVDCPTSGAITVRCCTDLNCLSCSTTTSTLNNNCLSVSQGSDQVSFYYAACAGSSTPQPTTPQPTTPQPTTPQPTTPQPTIPPTAAPTIDMVTCLATCNNSKSNCLAFYNPPGATPFETCACNGNYISCVGACPLDVPNTDYFFGAGGLCVAFRNASCPTLNCAPPTRAPTNSAAEKVLPFVAYALLGLAWFFSS